MSVKGQNKKEKSQARLLIVDDHPIIRDGLKELIEQESDLSVCGVADSAVQAMKLIETLRPDGAVVDISLNKDMSGIELIKYIKTRFPTFPVLVLSMHDEAVFAERALRAGAKGYVMKEQATEKLMAAIRQVLKGEIYLNEKIASKILSRLIQGRSDKHGFSVECLSDRELEVFEMIGRGLGTRDISEKLHLSVKTIEAHRTHIREKLKLKNSSELLQHAIQWVQAENMR